MSVRASIERSRLGAPSGVLIQQPDGSALGEMPGCHCKTKPLPLPPVSPPQRSSWQGASAAEFTFNEKTNADLAKKLKIPVYFAVPKSTWAKLPDIKTTDKLVEFKHPDGIKAKGDVGLRLVVAKRSGLSARLGKSGLLQTGDIMLTFRSEWGGAGAYPNIQMGISHTGFAYVDAKGNLRNLDNPMDGEYVGPGNLTSEHYRTLNFLHIIRPRNLTDAQKANLLAWATKLNASAGKVYPSQISFNQDYNKPKYQSGRPLDFVKDVRRRSRSARAILRQAARHVLLRVRVLAAVAAQLRSGEGCRGLQGQPRAVLRQGADGADEGDGQRPAAARPQLLLRPRRRSAAGHRPDGAVRRGAQADHRQHLRREPVGPREDVGRPSHRSPSRCSRSSRS